MFKNILLAIHGEEEEKFIRCALDLTKFYGASLTGLHITETSLAHYGYVDTLASSVAKEQFIDYIHQQADERKNRANWAFKARAEEMGLTFRWKTRDGNPADEILSEIKEGYYDLLILGTKPGSPGNTSKKVKEKIAKNPPCSILIVK